MNWLEFFEANRIDYATRGPNTKRGEISIRCPFCGEDDPSEHMGISLTAENWGCLRNAAHRGHKPERLVANILGCSYHQAALVVAQYSHADPSSLDGLPELPLTSGHPRPATRPPEEVPSLRPIKPTGLTGKFWRYLEGRGFSAVSEVLALYGLQACLTGKYKDRIIIPFCQEGLRVAWTGRAIVDPKVAPRYLSSDLIKTTIFNEDQVREGGRLLFIVEGPFDAIKLDYYGRWLGARATCISGTNMTPDQICFLNEVMYAYDKTVVLFDNDAIEPSYAALDWLHSPRVSLGELPDGVKDPGALSMRQIRELCDAKS